MKKGSKYQNRTILKTIFCLTIISIVLLLSDRVLAVTESEYKYLSDEDINPISVRVGYGRFLKNTTGSNTPISVKVEGAYYEFSHGLWAHATSTLVYDLRNYDYDYFTAYLGLNRTAAGNGVIYVISTSTDGKNWNIKYNEAKKVTKAGEDAQFVKIDIRTEKYLKLEIYDNGGNGNDHSVYADAKLIKETYKEPGEELVPSTTQLDEEIKTIYKNADVSKNEAYEHVLLKREFISRVGNYALRKFLSESSENEEVYKWLVEDIDNLRLYLFGGTPTGGYYNSLLELKRLYNEYSEDFSNTELLNNKWEPDLTYGELYKKMALALSLTHSSPVALWMQGGATENKSDSLRRYAIYKYLHKEGMMRVADNFDVTPWFESLKIEEMRLLFNNLIDDEEIIWLNRYTQQNIDQNPNRVGAYISPHPYMAYVWPNYSNDLFYIEENKDYFNKLFSVGGVGLFDLEYTIPGGKNTKEYKLKITRGTTDYKLYKVWMNFRNQFGTGAVCGGISKSGSNIRASHGIPATVIGQPGHAAFLYYSKNEEGKGYWSLDNNVSGWALSEKGERMLLGWGGGNYPRSTYQVVYMTYAQEALNDYENFIKCEEQVMIAKVYQGDLKTQEHIYRNAIRIQPFNIDAWLGLINLYINDSTKTEDDLYGLVEEIASAFKYYPLAMYDLTNVIKPKLKDVTNIYKFTLLQTKTLTEASKTPNNSADNYYIFQPSITRTEANFLLNNLDKSIATFSFDGVDANKIVLSSRFDGMGVRLEYSVDGKQTWKEIFFTAEDEHKWKLSQTDLSQITADTDIYINIVGVNRVDENLYKIDITEQPLLSNLYANDLENEIIGVDSNTEWRYTENDAWVLYSTTKPDLTGNKTIQVRQKATGTKLASPSSEIYTFHEDNQPDTRKYVKISHLSITEYSTQSVDNKRPFYAPNAIDGNLNTLWHTDFRENVLGLQQKPFITIKLDSPRYISALEFIQTKYKVNDPDFIKDATIYVSEDGSSWVEAGRIENCPQDTELRNITFNESVYGQYVKLELTTYNMFASIAMVNLFEDTTKISDKAIPTAEISYSIKRLTNQNVIATLVNPSKEITIINNGGSDTYVFEQNGSFTFSFIDKNGNVGSVTAVVDWIDKSTPTGDIKYSLDCEKKLRILLDNISEDVYLLDNNNKKINYIEVDNNKVTRITYLDDNGNSYKVLHKDENGNTNKITYKNITGNVEIVEEYVTTLKDGNVVKEEYFDEDGNKISISDAEKATLRELQQTTRSNPLEYALEVSGEYEFKLVDKAENILYKSIRVDYLENSNIIIASDITYDIMKVTNQNVVATIKPYIIDTEGKKVEVEIVNNNKKEEYTFTENGEFTFEYKDASDTDNYQVKSHKAKVDWIDKVSPTAEIFYQTKEPTNDPVIVTLGKESKEITVINNNGKREYVFTENGEFTFEFVDKAGNKGTATAKVDWINKPEEPQPMLGDVNQDGKITVTDLLLVKRHLVSENNQDWVLTGSKLKVADMNSDGKITPTDLLLIKRLVLQKGN